MLTLLLSGGSQASLRGQRRAAPSDDVVFQSAGAPVIGDRAVLQRDPTAVGEEPLIECVKLVHGLHQQGQEVTLAGPEGREFSRVARELGFPFHTTPPVGSAVSIPMP